MRSCLALAILLSLPATTASAEPTTAAGDDPAWLARSNRLAVSLGAGVGTISLGGFEDLAQDLETVFAGQGVTLSETPSSGMQINAELDLRYYFPYHLLAQVGYGTVYNWTKVDAQAGVVGGTVSNHNLVMEVPVLLGGHYPLSRRISLNAAVGPSFFFYSRSYWDADPGSVTDFRADGGVGFHLLAGADFFANDHFAAGLELRYRHLSGNDLRELESGVVVSSGMLLGDGSSEVYPIDYSGISVGLKLRFFVL